MERVFAVSKNLEKKFLNKEITNVMKEDIEKRSEICRKEGFSIISNEPLSTASFFYPIIANSDSIGSVILVDQELTEEDKNLIRFVTSILVKNIED